MPNAQLWSIMWFLMLITLGIDTQFGMLEGVITPIRDAKWFPNLRIEVLTGMKATSVLLEPMKALEIRNINKYLCWLS